MLNSFILFSFISYTVLGEDAVILEADLDEDLGFDTVEMSEDTFVDLLQYYVPVADATKELEFCKQIGKADIPGKQRRKACLAGTTRLDDNKNLPGLDLDLDRDRKVDDKGNEGPGECMYFKRKTNKIANYYESKCLSPAQFVQYRDEARKERATNRDMEEIATVEIPMGLLDELTANMPVTDASKELEFCKQIGKADISGRERRKACLSGTTRLDDNKNLPGLDLTLDRDRKVDDKGNEGTGECMYFKRKTNKIANYYGSKCLSPAQFVQYRDEARKERDVSSIMAVLTGSESTALDYNVIALCMVVLAVAVVGVAYKCGSIENKSVLLNEKLTGYQSI